jgi:hypothetical protein
MESVPIIKLEIRLQSPLQGTKILITIEVNVFVFDGPPKSLNVNIVFPSSLAIHTHQYVMILQNTDEPIRSELAALISVEDSQEYHTVLTLPSRPLHRSVCPYCSIIARKELSYYIDL